MRQVTADHEIESEAGLCKNGNLLSPSITWPVGRDLESQAGQWVDKTIVPPIWRMIRNSFCQCGHDWSSVLAAREPSSWTRSSLQQWLLFFLPGAIPVFWPHQVCFDRTRCVLTAPGYPRLPLPTQRPGCQAIRRLSTTWLDAAACWLLTFSNFIPRELRHQLEADKRPSWDKGNELEKTCIVHFSVDIVGVWVFLLVLTLRTGKGNKEDSTESDRKTVYQRKQPNWRETTE